MPTLDISPDDEIINAREFARISGGRSVRWAQYQFEQGEPDGIFSFHMGREEVTTRGFWRAWVHRMIEKENKRREELG